MVIGERARHELFVKLEQILGREEATTLMEHLPPIGWADVATKRDLDALEERTELRFESLEHQIERLGVEFRHELATSQSAVREELRGLREEMLAGDAAVREELRDFREQQRTSDAMLRVDLTQRISDAVRTMVLAFVSSVIAATALGFGAARLG